jgi:hypothetical protein
MTDYAFTRPSLIAPEAETKGYEGAGILEAALGVRDGIRDHEVMSVLGNGLAVGLSAISAIMDPFQAIFAAGVGWLMEHVSILREPLDWLAGDPKEIEGHAQTWRNIEKRLHDATDLYVDEVKRSTAHWTSEAATAYGARARGHAEDIQALGTISEVLAEMTLVAGAMVGVVRNTVRDMIAEVVGAAISKAVQVVLVVTIPKVVAEVALMVAEYSAKILALLRKLLAAVAKLTGKIPPLTRLIERISSSLGAAERGASRLGAFRAQAAEEAASSSDGLLKTAGRAWGTAWGTIGEGNRLAYGGSRQVLADKLRTAPRDNGIQNAGATAEKLPDGDESRPIDLPL